MCPSATVTASSGHRIRSHPYVLLSQSVVLSSDVLSAAHMIRACVTVVVARCSVGLWTYHMHSLAPQMPGHCCCQVFCDSMSSQLHKLSYFVLQVRDLMVYLEAQQQVQASGEMAQGTVLPVPEPAPAPKRKGNKGRGR